MAPRDTYHIDYFCEKCGTKAVVHYSENEEEGPDDSLDVKVEKIEGPVEAKYAGDNRIEVSCKKCGKILRH